MCPNLEYGKLHYFNDFSSIRCYDALLQCCLTISSSFLHTSQYVYVYCSVPVCPVMSVNNALADTSGCLLADRCQPGKILTYAMVVLRYQHPPPSVWPITPGVICRRVLNSTMVLVSLHCLVYNKLKV